MLTDFRKALEEKKKEVAETTESDFIDLEEDQNSEVESAALSRVLHAISEVGDTYKDKWFIQSGDRKKGTVKFRVKLPPPAFFFLEYGTPFILHSMALPQRPGTATKRLTPSQTFDRQVRTCCVAIVEPKLTLRFLSRLPRTFIQRLYALIVDLVAPEQLIYMVQAFLNKTKDAEGRMQLLEIYLMSGKSSRATTEYLFDRIANPHLLNALEHIIFEIGNEYDRKNKTMELKAMAGGSMKRGFFG